MARSIVAFVASQAIRSGVKRAARDSGVMPGEKGSWTDIISGLIVDLAVDLAVDAVTDPTNQMVTDLEARLTSVERTILDGTHGSPGFLTALRRLTLERIEARRELLTPAAH